MKRSPHVVSLAATLALVAISPLLPARASDVVLRAIAHSGGGQLLTGTVAGTTTLRGATIATVRELRGRFRNAPALSNVLVSRSGESVALFFNVRDARRGGVPTTGMIIVSSGKGSPAAAVLYDRATAFRSTIGGLLSALGSAAVPRSGEISGAAEPLQAPVTFQDDSGTVSLPVGWRIVTSGAGSVRVAGPRGEALELGVIFQNIYDPRSPQTPGMVRYLAMSRQSFYVVPFGGDLEQAWVAINGQDARRQGTAGPQFEISQRVPVRANQYQVYASSYRGTLVSPAGPLATTLTLGAMHPAGIPSWAMTVQRVSVPVDLVDREAATVRAIVASYHQNGRVIEQETQVVIAGIEATGRASRAAAASRSAANDDRTAGIEASSNASRAYDKGVDNYIRDETVTADSQTNTHISSGYGFADALVRSDPSRFTTVPPSQYVEGDR